MQYDIRAWSYDYYHIWNLIIGVQYVTIGTYGCSLCSMMEELAGEMEIKKPFVILSVNQMRAAEYHEIKQHDIFDYEFGV